MLDTLGLQQPPDLDGTGRREAAVAIHQQGCIWPQRPPDRGHDRLGPARPLVDVMPALGTDAELEGVEAQLALQPDEAGGLVLRA